MIHFEQGEQIVKVVRRHWLVLIPMVILLVVLALAPTLLYTFLTKDFVNLNEQVVWGIGEWIDSWGTFGYSVWLLLLWMIFFIEWTNYYLDLWVITDRRIIDVEQIGFFHRDVTSFNYAQIQDITVETRGFIQALLKFGTLHIQTAGHSRNIIIRDAHYPEDARALILQLQQKAV